MASTAVRNPRRPIDTHALSLIRQVDGTHGAVALYATGPREATILDMCHK